MCEVFFTNLQLERDWIRKLRFKCDRVGKMSPHANLLETSQKISPAKKENIHC